MRNLFLITILLTLGIAGSVTAQNIPVIGSTTPDAPTVGLVDLPVPYVIPSSGLNLTRTFIPMRMTASATDGMFHLSPSSASGYPCKVSTTYLNGWGSTMQTISRGHFGGRDVVAGNDLRTSLTNTSFLPFAIHGSSQFQTTPFDDQRAYYSTTYHDEGGMSYSQSITSYPGDVPTVKAFSPGASLVGQGNGNTITSTVNDGTEGIIMYYYDAASGDAVTAGTYPAGQLTIKTTLAPHSAKTIEFFDKNGREICKKVYAGAGSGAAFTWQTTYYVYNDLSKLTHIITPMGSRRLALPGSYAFSNAADLIYTYKYNELGSVSERFIAGQTGKHYTVYDKKNRPVLYQTPLLHDQATPMYRFNIYDSRDRVIISGLLTNAADFSTWQTIMNTDPATLVPVPATGSLLDYLIHGVGSTYPTSITDCEIDQVNYYDEYVIPRIFSYTYATNTGGVSTPFATDYEPYMVTQGLLTSSLTRVRDGGMNTTSDLWTAAVYYYDKDGRLIQLHSLNGHNAASYADCLSGTTPAPWDTLFTRYDFTGHKLMDITIHNESNTTTTPITTETTKTIDRYSYDYMEGARLSSVTQSINDGAEVPISAVTFDELGRTTKKSLGGVEIQNYDYNIRGQLTGINSDYTDDPCCAQGTTATFGCKLSYDYGFAQPRFDGSISGIKWRGASHNKPLGSYGYEYDPAGRLRHAEFREFSDPYGHQSSCGSYISLSGMSWNKGFTDYTVSNMRYDDNGNILSMNQKGMDITGGTGIVDIDILTYGYKPWTNQLKGVKDDITINYLLGDFQDAPETCDPTDQITIESPSMEGMGYPGDGEGSTVTYTGPGGGSTSVPPPSGLCPDYDYDADGNLIKDANKKILSIVYNDMDQPMSVTFDNGGGVLSYIDNVYDAAGRLISKKITDGAATILPAATEYTYAGPLKYKNGVLQYALHSEGRARFSPPPAPGTGLFTYDYFVKDHLGNVRTVVTGNVTNAPPGFYPPDDPLPGHIIRYRASHEPKDNTTEAATFSNIANVRDIKPCSNDVDDMYAARLNGGDSSRRIGTSLMLQVMVGDTFDVSAQCFYDDTADNGYESSGSMLDALLGTLSGGMAVANAENGIRTVTGSVSSTDFDAFQTLVEEQTDPAAPRAYINYLVFDEQMKLKPELSGAIQVVKESGEWHTIGLSKPIRVDINGYVNISISNSSIKNVHFDHVTVNLYHGVLLQENHYYPYGLTVGNNNPSALKNAFKYQGKELQDDLGFDLYDFTARQYDPQIGRFWGIDPANQFPSGYTGMSNDPGNMIDPTGCVSRRANTASESAPLPSGVAQTISQVEIFFTPWIFGEDGGVGYNYDREKVYTAQIDQDGVTKDGAGDGNGDKKECSPSPVDKAVDACNTAVTWFGNNVAQPINEAVNPLYYIANAVSGATTGKDIITGAPMSKGETVSYACFALMAFIPGGPEVGIGARAAESTVKNVGTHVVYQGVDKAGVVRYVGITSRDAEVRFSEHLASNTERALLRYEVIPAASKLTKTEARAWEQTIINRWGLGKNGGTLLNKVNSIAPKNWSMFGIH